jgi:hypothetical protein
MLKYLNIIIRFLLGGLYIYVRLFLGLTKRCVFLLIVLGKTLNAGSEEFT